MTRSALIFDGPDLGKKGLIEGLVVNALNLLDCKTLTPRERTKAEQLYELASALELGE